MRHAIKAQPHPAATNGRLVADQELMTWSVGHPFSALLTAAMISLMVIVPLPLASPAGQAATFAVPRAMFTSVMRSSIVTSKTLLQSPTHVFGVAVTDDVGVVVALRLGVADGVPVGVAIRVGVKVEVEVAVGC